MDIALFSMEGLQFVLRWFHFFFGVVWIGLLYYFNFVQTPFMAETDAATKSGVLQKLAPRALWWFRWGAMLTLITGLLIIGMRAHNGAEIFATSWGVAILTGAACGIVMWSNVWFVIWPNQKIVIANASGNAQPNAPAAAARAGIASRTNTMLSIPMLFFMGAASHLPIQIGMESSLATYWAVFLALLVAIWANAIKGKMGPMASVRGVIHLGFALALVIYALMEIIL